MVLFILAVVWAVYLVSWFRTRSETRSGNSISSFSRHLSVLERTAPGARQGGARAADFGPARAAAGLGPLSSSVAPRRSAQAAAKKRRKDILMGLLAATGVTALGGLVLGGPLRLLFVVSLLLTVAYVALLAQAQKRVLEQRSKVRYLGPSGAVSPVAPVAWDDEAWYDEAYDEPTADGTYPTADVHAYPQPQSGYMIARR
ncbi:hypothetical protein [Rhabdothermincola salaria]|uniref:hypothetical protein n=1 Tax=Rhabdothermincola salaria TaxID=2903142 RepID=UPI001E382024|nr:hypothetical protein [Rhabdothermincola salaria]MCD9623776.1 hypothetical protein [Rhabdothermincola salaria]